MTKQKTTREVTIRIKDDPLVDKLEGSLDLAEYYRHHLPFEIKQNNTDKVILTIPRNRALPAEIHIDYENGVGSIKYHIYLDRKTRGGKK